MLNYFSNYASNAHHVCCENTTTKVYMTIANPMTLTFIQGHKCILSLTTYFNYHYLQHYLSYYILTWHDGRPIHGIYAHSRVDDTDLECLMQGHSESAKANIQC